MEGRLDRYRRPALALPALRCEVQLPHGDRAGALQEVARHLGRLRQADAVGSATGRLRGDVPHRPPDRLGVAPPPLRRPWTATRTESSSGERLDRRDLHRRHRPLERLWRGPQARPLEAEALHRGRHRRPQGAGRRRVRARQAVLGAHNKAMKTNIAKGATLVHEKERTHNVLVRELELEDASSATPSTSSRCPW